MKVRNTFIIFIVSGFWHGANWTFIVWEALNAVYFLPLLLTNKNCQNMEVVAEDSYLPSLKEFGQMAMTFGLTVIAWVFFRAENIGHAMSYLGGMFSESLFSVHYYLGIGYAKFIIPLILSSLIIEWLGRSNTYAFKEIWTKNKPFKWWYYTILILFFYYSSKKVAFIYFQF